MSASKRLLVVASGILGAILLIIACSVIVWNDDGTKEDFEDLAALYAWSNDADDGMSAFHKTQHGVTKIISGCDADDPGCLYHMSKNFDYSQSYWTGPSVNLNADDPRNEVYGLMPPEHAVHHLAPEEQSSEERQNDQNLHRLQVIWREMQDQVLKDVMRISVDSFH